MHGMAWVADGLLNVTVLFAAEPVMEVRYGSSVRSVCTMFDEYPPIRQRVDDGGKQ